MSRHNITLFILVDETLCGSLRLVCSGENKPWPFSAPKLKSLFFLFPGSRERLIPGRAFISYPRRELGRAGRFPQTHPITTAFGKGLALLRRALEQPQLFLRKLPHGPFRSFTQLEPDGGGGRVAPPPSPPSPFWSTRANNLGGNESRTEAKVNSATKWHRSPRASKMLPHRGEFFPSTSQMAPGRYLPFRFEVLSYNAYIDADGDGGSGEDIHPGRPIQPNMTTTASAGMCLGLDIVLGKLRGLFPSLFVPFLVLSPTIFPGLSS